MPVGGARRSFTLRLRPAAGVRELQAHQQVIGRPEALDVGVYEDAAELGEVPGRVWPDTELVRVGPTTRAYRHSLAAPDQLCSALAEPRPPAANQVGGPTIGGAIPALHRQDRPTVTNNQGARGTVPYFEGLRQGGAGADDHLRIERQVDTERSQVPGECCGVGKPPDLDRGHQPRTPMRRPRSVRASRSPSGRRTAPSGTRSALIHPRSLRNWAALWR